MEVFLKMLGITKMFWQPKTLKCQIYEDDILLNLNTLHEVVLEELVYAIYPLWRTSPHSVVWYAVEVFEKKSLFKLPSVSIEIEAYIRDVSRPSGRRQVSINMPQIQSKIGRKFSIQPKDTMLKKWTTVEVAFVV